MQLEIAVRSRLRADDKVSRTRRGCDNPTQTGRDSFPNDCKVTTRVKWWGFLREMAGYRGAFYRRVNT